MKKVLKDLFLGQELLAQVVECVGPNEFIVNFEGDLLNVKNKSLKIIKPHDQVKIIVTGIHPLAFKLKDSAKKNRFSLSI